MSVIDPKLHDDAARLRALQRYSIVDTGQEPAFDLITGLVCDLLNVPICAVSLIDEERQWFKSRQGLDLEQTPRSIALCAHTICSRQLLVVPDTRRDARFARNPLVTGVPRIRAYAGVPLTTPDGYNIGSLCAIDREVRTFREDELKLLGRFARLVVEQLELRTLAMTDALTGALSRRGFVEAARKALRDHLVTQTSAAMVSFDLDRFKSVNDRHGHDCGNDVLHAIGRVSISQLSPDDRFGRLGGEEFGVLLVGVTAEQAKEKAEHLRRALAEIEHPKCGPVTGSFGVAMLKGNIDVDDWLGQAEMALRTAKEGGRNGTILHDPERDERASAMIVTGTTWPSALARNYA